MKMEANDLIKAHYTSVQLACTDLDKDEWARASATVISRYWSGAEAPQARQAEARIIWSKDALSVRFVCRQDEPLVMSAAPQVERKTVGLWERDVCEIFVAPDAENPQRYLEFEAAPSGEWLDLAVEYKEAGREADWDFNSGMTVAARIREGFVTIALCVPWAAFGREPHANERWRVNLFRCVGAGASRGYLAWQPTRTTQPNFHVPSAFGWLLFNDEG
ncbi:MAG TPA: carbohydrate-binding family 9-like protein [Pyrinomonadaceae bacterium]|jgi:hypothetical protein